MPGAWGALRDRVDTLVACVTAEVRELAAVTVAVARGDLSREMSVPAQGELRALNDTLNTMLAELRALADEVARIARDVGMTPRAEGSAISRRTAGVWKQLTENLTLRAAVARGHARGDRIRRAG